MGGVNNLYRGDMVEMCLANMNRTLQYFGGRVSGVIVSSTKEIGNFGCFIPNLEKIKKLNAELRPT